MSSYATTIQKDQRVVAESAELVVSPEATMSMPYSIAVGPGGRVDYSNIDYFPADVQQTIKDILAQSADIQKEALDALKQVITDSESVTQAVLKSSEQSQQALVEQAKTLQTGGDVTAVTKYLPYAIIISIVVVVLSRAKK